MTFFKSINIGCNQQSFNRFIINFHDNYPMLEDMIKQLRVDQLKCRYNIWRWLLGVYQVKHSLAEAITQKRRHYYEEKADAYANVRIVGAGGTTVVVSPIKPITAPTNPLAQPSRNPLANPLKANNAVAAQKTTDTAEFLLEQIEKDVSRTYQQMSFFTHKEVLKILTDVLFVWCRKNSDISYKQGMNQLLASIVYVYFQQCVPAAQGINHTSPNTEAYPSVYYYCNSAYYAQPDIYAIFDALLRKQGEMFRDSFKEKINGNPNSKVNTPILKRINRLQQIRLREADLELYSLLKMRQIQTKTFLLRWIRCLHTRQFPLSISFNIWDSILLKNYQSNLSNQSQDFQFADSMCLALFIYVRTFALSRDTPHQIQQLYQKYPGTQKLQIVRQIVNLAWTLYQEQKKPKLSSHQQIEDQKKQLDEKKLITSDDKKQSIQQKKQSEQQHYKSLHPNASNALHLLLQAIDSLPSEYTSLNAQVGVKLHRVVDMLKRIG